MEAGDKNEFENKNSSKWYNVPLDIKCWWTQNVTKWNWHMNAVFLALCNNSDAFKQRNLLCPKFHGKDSVNSIDIYLNKPQSIRIIKIGFDYILSIFIICWLILNFGLDSLLFASSSAHSIILFILCLALSCFHVCVCVCGHFYPNR